MKFLVFSYQYKSWFLEILNLSFKRWLKYHKERGSKIKSNKEFDE